MNNANKCHWVMDIETMSDCFLSVFKHYKTEETHIFVIGKLKNDLAKLLDFLQTNITEKQWHISFNGLSFDAQIIQYLLNNKKLFTKLTGEQIAVKLYREAQETITRSNNKEFPKFREKDLYIRQIDVFKLNHWDSAAKSASLKWIQCSMDWHNVKDMPLHHTESIDTQEKLDDLIFYCMNDVDSTKAIMQHNAKDIKLRGTLTDTYKINLYSASEPRISKELFLHFMSQRLGISKYDLRQMRTLRDFIYVKDILLPYLQFDVQEFKDLHQKFQNLVIDANKTKGAFAYSVNYRGVQTDFGLGGVHGAKSGIHKSDEFMTIMTSDIVSYYPNLAIKNKWSPAHLPKNDFCEQYEWFFNERMKIPKKDPRNYTYKIVLNSSYGLSNDKNSFLYDPEYTMRVTINGQLSLMMLYTSLTERIPGCIPLMQNTDGIEMMIPRKYKKLYLEICKDWEAITKLSLEHDEYQKLIVPDCNNYIAVFSYKEISKEDFDKFKIEYPDNLFKEETDKFYMAKTKCKGRFEFKDRALHKNKSFDVISKALYYYFVHGIEPEEYVKQDTNIFDFCGMVKAEGNWKFEYTQVVHQKVIREALQKTLRYYISTEGGKTVKHNIYDGRDIQVEAGPWLQTVFNQYVDKPFEEYNINYAYYLNRIKKEIYALEPTQLNLEF